MTKEEKRIIQRVVLAGVVMRDDRALILQRHSNESIYPGMWELPSGKKENLESSETALLREVKEETGLDVEIVSLVSIFDYQIEKPDEIRDSTQINFLVKPLNTEKVVLSSEHQAFTWIGLEEISVYDITDATKGVLRKALKIAERLDALS